MLYHASGVDRITDYNGFSPRRSREGRQGHKVYLTFLFKATFLFNCIYLIFILEFCRLCVH